MPERTKSLPQENISKYFLPEKKNQFSSKERISYNYWKDQFSKQKVSDTCAKSKGTSFQMYFEYSCAIFYVSKNQSVLICEAFLFLHILIFFNILK